MLNRLVDRRFDRPPLLRWVVSWPAFCPPGSLWYFRATRRSLHRCFYHPYSDSVVFGALFRHVLPPPFGCLFRRSWFCRPVAFWSVPCTLSVSPPWPLRPGSSTPAFLPPPSRLLGCLSLTVLDQTSSAGRLLDPFWSQFSRRPLVRDTLYFFRLVFLIVFLNSSAFLPGLALRVVPSSREFLHVSGLRGVGTRAPRVLPPPTGTFGSWKQGITYHRLTEVPSVDMLIEALNSSIYRGHGVSLWYGFLRKPQVHAPPVPVRSPALQLKTLRCYTHQARIQELVKGGALLIIVF